MFMTRILVGLLVIMGIAAFAFPQPALPTQTETIDDPADSAAPHLQSTATPTAQPPTPEPTATPTSPDMVIWWPADIMPDAGTPEEESILSLLDNYRAEFDQSVLLRVKRLTGTGSILSTLRTAQDVAPSALPDLVLLDRATFVEAAATGLIFPLDSTVAAELTSNLYNRASALGQFDEMPYGIPYTLLVQHAAFAASVFEDTPNTQRDLLDSGEPFAFSIDHETGVSDALLIQYVAAGGRLADSEGNTVLDEAALADVLTFYADALQAEQITSAALDYTAQHTPWDDLLNGTVSLAQVDSSTFLSQQAQHPGHVPIILPTENGSALTTLDGWIWAISTPDLARQARAIDLIEWAMRVENQVNLTAALQALPSQRAALRVGSDTTYNTLIDRLLSNSRAVLPEQVSNAMAAAMQEALVSVLSGETTPEDAAAAATARING